jgi:hypothetical protein
VTILSFSWKPENGEYEQQRLLLIHLFLDFNEERSIVLCTYLETQDVVG